MGLCERNCDWVSSFKETTVSRLDAGTRSEYPTHLALFLSVPKKGRTALLSTRVVVTKASRLMSIFLRRRSADLSLEYTTKPMACPST